MAAGRPRVRGDLTVVELDGEAVVYDEVSGELHHLNPSATLVFGLLDGSATLPELAADLSATFAIPAGEMEAQVHELAARLGELGLLDGDESAGA